MSFKLLGLGAALLSNVALALDSPPFAIDPSTRSFRDANGRHTIFHGVNAVYKVDPYIPDDAQFHSQHSMTIEDM